MVKASSLVGEGVAMRACNGKSTRIWKDKWINGKVSVPKHPYTKSSHPDLIMVSDLINTNGDWKANLV